MIIRSFGKLSDGNPAGLYILSNKNGMEAHLTDYGAAIVRLIVPDRYDQFRDVVLGYDEASGYEKGGIFLGGTVGRYANRISNAAFDMNGRHYILTANDGPNALHGGRDYYVHRIWSPVISFGSVSSRDLASTYAVESMNDWSRVPREGSYGDSITFRLVSPDGDQGFPGEVIIDVTYTLTDDNELHIDYHAVLSSDKAGIAIRPGSRRDSSRDRDRASAEIGIPASQTADEDRAKSAAATDSASGGDAGRILSTPLNLTNHSYFNLNGHGSGTVLTQIVQITADRFTETDSRSIPTGTLLDVKWTPMDFRQPKTLLQDIEADYEPLRFGNGYDHNYVLNTGEAGSAAGTPETGAEYRKVASMYSADSGIRMEVLTDLPGMQLYSANYVDGEPGKDGAVYGRRSAVCFETQFWPDAVNKENFPGGMLREGEVFDSRTTYRFGVSGAE